MSETCLLLDATNRWIVCGLKDAQGIHGQTLLAPGEASQRLAGLIQNLLRARDCSRPDWIVAALGPGSFTGARITVSTARNLAQLWEVPVLGVESLVFYGYDLLRRGERTACGVLVDGKQNRVFARLADPARAPGAWAEHPVLDVPPERLLELWPQGTPLFVDDETSVRRYLTGDAGRVAFQELPAPEVASLYELARELGGREAAGTFEELVPVYVRPDPAHAKYPQGYSPKL